MYSIEVHKTVNRMISVFYFFGLWQHDNVSFRSLCLRIWYLVVYGCTVLAIALGSLTTDNESEMVFLAVMAIVGFVLEFRLYFFLWKKEDILGFIGKMGVHSIKDEEKFNQVNDRINIFLKWVSYFEVMLATTVVTMTVSALPLFSTGRKLPLNYYFPFEWKDDAFLYFGAYVFVTCGLWLSSFFTFFNAIIWYMMLSCAIKYEILGNEFKNIGVDSEVAIDGKQDIFLLELIDLIKKHKQLRE